MSKKNFLIIIFLGISTCCMVFAWSEPRGKMPKDYLSPIDISGENQNKRGGLTIEEDLNVVGSSNICQLTQQNCPSGYYSSDGVLYGTYKMCCKSN